MFKFLGDIFNNIGKFFSAVEKSKQVQDFEKFCEAVYTEEKVLIWSQLKDIAIAAVTGLLTSALSGKEKFGVATQQVLAQAAASGIQAGITDVNKVVQDAYIYVTSNGANGGVVTVPPITTGGTVVPKVA